MQKVRKATIGKKGSALVEAVFGLAIVGALLLLHVELTRRVHLMALVHHGAFVFARSRALGLSYPKAKEQVGQLFKKSYGKANWKMIRELEISDHLDSKGRVVGRVHFEYKSLKREPFSGGIKHDYEVTGKCHF